MRTERNPALAHTYLGDGVGLLLVSGSQVRPVLAVSLFQRHDDLAAAGLEGAWGQASYGWDGWGWMRTGECVERQLATDLHLAGPLIVSASVRVKEWLLPFRPTTRMAKEFGVNSACE